MYTLYESHANRIYRVSTTMHDKYMKTESGMCWMQGCPKTVVTAKLKTDWMLLYIVRSLYCDLIEQKLKYQRYPSCAVIIFSINHTPYHAQSPSAEPSWGQNHALALAYE